MDNHPIPQDITGFQFKLIGEMTIKQFAYLASGVVLGFLVYLLPISFFITLPFAIFSSLFGIGLAFFPVFGRPMDVMILQFIKALLKPTQFVYQKTGKPLFLPTPIIHAQKNIPVKQGEVQTKFVTQSAIRPKNKLDNKENTFFEKVKIISVRPVNEQKKEPEEKKEEALGQQAVSLEKELEITKKDEASLPQQSLSQTVTHQKVLELERQLKEVLGQKDKLREELLSLQKTLDSQRQKTLTPSVASLPNQPEPKPQAQNVKQVPLPFAPQVPNLVGGILKDSRGNPLPNMLVEVKDQEGNPVRAFKTNGLGQFISSTPLLNGTYTIAFEDPKAQHRFDAIQFSAKGEIILPIEVTSVDQREELRRDLFGPATGGQ